MVKINSFIPADPVPAGGPKVFCTADSTAYFAIPITVDTEATTLCNGGVYMPPSGGK